MVSGLTVSLCFQVYHYFAAHFKCPHCFSIHSHPLGSIHTYQLAMHGKSKHVSSHCSAWYSQRHVDVLFNAWSVICSTRQNPLQKASCSLRLRHARRREKAGNGSWHSYSYGAVGPETFKQHVGQSQPTPYLGLVLRAIQVSQLLIILLKLCCHLLLLCLNKGGDKF